METNFESRILPDMPYMIVAENMIEEINSLFLDLTGYEKKNILGMDVKEVWQQLLRISLNIEDIEDSHEADCYMFDRNRNVKEITIRYSEMVVSEKCVYTFQQKKNIMLEEKFPFFESINLGNNTGVALYSIPDLVLLKANNSYFQHYNKRYKNKEEILGLTLIDLIPGANRDELKEAYMNMIKSDLPLSFKEQLIEFPEIGSRYIDLILTPIFEEGSLRYIIQTHYDVTETVMCRQALSEKKRIIEEQKSQLEIILETVSKSIGLLIIDKDGRFFGDRDMIENYFMPFGYKENIMETYAPGIYFDENGNELLPEDLPISKALQGENVSKSRLTMKLQDEIRHFSMNGTPVFDRDGNVLMAVVCGWDITSEVEKRNQMEDIIRMKDEFIYLMSHEFKTPLTVINAAVQTLEYIYAGQIPEKAGLMIEKVKQNVYRQLRLVDNMLDITRINAGQVKLSKRNVDIVFLAKAITESVAFYAQQKGVEMIFISKLSQKVIGVDDEKFERIMLNLLSNAIKFTPKGKKVVVELSAKMHNNRRMICIKVKDQGVGIPKEKQSQVFKRFGQIDSLLTRPAEGSGIGLHLVKLMVDAFDGEISIESESGKGSIFTLLISSKKARNSDAEREEQEIFNKRIIQSIATELSDIYF